MVIVRHTTSVPTKPPTTTLRVELVLLMMVAGGLDCEELLAAIVDSVFWVRGAEVSCCMQALCVALLSCGRHCLLSDTEAPFT